MQIMKIRLKVPMKTMLMWLKMPKMMQKPQDWVWKPQEWIPKPQEWVLKPQEWTKKLTTKPPMPNQQTRRKENVPTNQEVIVLRYGVGEGER